MALGTVIQEQPLTNHARLGICSDRGGIQSTPIDISHEQVPGMGFVIHEALALSIANSRSVAKGVRY